MAEDKDALPEPECFATVTDRGLWAESRSGKGAAFYTADQMRTYRAAAVAAEREISAKLAEALERICVEQDARQGGYASIETYDSAHSALAAYKEHTNG